MTANGRQLTLSVTTWGKKKLTALLLIGSFVVVFACLPAKYGWIFAQQQQQQQLLSLGISIVEAHLFYLFILSPFFFFFSIFELASN